MRLTFVVGALAALFLCTAPGGPAHAQSNPLTGGATAERVEPAPSVGWYAQFGRWIVGVQRDVNRRIGTTMQAIREGENPVALMIGLGAAFLYGVVHAIGPGHGKMIVVTYFLSGRARPWRGLAMGVKIAFFHVVSAVIAVAMADFILRQTFGGPPGAIREVKIASYGLIAAIGLYMLVRALRGGGRHPHHHGDGDHGGAHSETWLSLAIGIVPCTGAVLILIYAIANDILVEGFAMVLAIAVGMSLTMIALGLVAIYARGALGRFLDDDGDRPIALGRWLAVAGAVLILALGTALMLAEFAGAPLLPGEF